jgi:hypothetical protein
MKTQVNFFGIDFLHHTGSATNVCRAVKKPANNITRELGWLISMKGLGAGAEKLELVPGYGQQQRCQKETRQSECKQDRCVREARFHSAVRIPKTVAVMIMKL